MILYHSIVIGPVNWKPTKPGPIVIYSFDTFGGSLKKHIKQTPHNFHYLLNCPIINNLDKSVLIRKEKKSFQSPSLSVFLKSSENFSFVSTQTHSHGLLRQTSRRLTFSVVFHLFLHSSPFQICRHTHSYCCRRLRNLIRPRSDAFLVGISL